MVPCGATSTWFLMSTNYVFNFPRKTVILTLKTNRADIEEEHVILKMIVFKRKKKNLPLKHLRFNGQNCCRLLPVDRYCGSTDKEVLKTIMKTS